jgi:hypothetical protein
MSMATRIDAAIGSPAELEALYRAAVEAGEVEEFAAEIVRRHALTPENALVAAWFHRLRPRAVSALDAATPAARPADASAARRVRRAQWVFALVLSGILSLIYAALGSTDRTATYLRFAWGPAAAVLLLVFLKLGRGETLLGSDAPALPALRWRPLVAIALLAVMTLTAIRRSYALTNPTDADILTLIHLPALAWLALGWAVLGPRAAPIEVFAAVRKSIETVITAGLFGAAGAALTLIGAGLFRALGVVLPEWLTRWVVFGGPGLIPVMAVAMVYDPDRTPSGQPGEHGLARIIFMTGRLFLPLTLVVLVIYLLATPFRFMEPFRNRDVLIIYNAMLFAVIALLVAATPLGESEVPGRTGLWVRRGIVAVAACALLVSLHALAAVVFRTGEGGLTVNRLTVIGWNIVNIATLTLLLFRLGTDGPGAWIAASHRAFRIGLMGYATWTLFVLLSMQMFPPGLR